MKLWHLLIGVCLAAAMGGALAPPKIANTGLVGYIWATAAGLAVGIFFSWTMWWMHKAFVPTLLRRVEEHDPLSEWYGRAFYVSKVVWIICAGILGFWLSSTLLRLVL